MFEPVPRIPIAFQFWSMRTPSAEKGTGKCSICQPSSGSSQGALVISRSPAGEPLAKNFFALTR